jgi:uncharacterized protein
MVQVGSVECRLLARYLIAELKVPVMMKPRELTKDECEKILAVSRFGRLGLALGDAPYVVPISYVYSQGKIFLHSRPGGKKVEIASHNPRVCFEVDLMEKGRWASVIAYGTANLSSDIAAKMRMFDSFTDRQMKGHGGKPFNREDMEKMPMLIWEIEIGEMTGREGIW